MQKPTGHLLIAYGTLFPMDDDDDDDDMCMYACTHTTFVPSAFSYFPREMSSLVYNIPYHFYDSFNNLTKLANLYTPIYILDGFSSFFLYALMRTV